MVQSVPLTVLVTALLINSLSYCSAESVYCVTPTATSCSFCSPNTHCATLSEYAQEAERYFTSNTTMVFLPGDHVLDTNITVANVTRLTMRGESSSSGSIATVVRNGSVGFSFISMVDFNMYSLAFTSYNRSWGYGSCPASSSALLLQSTHYAKLVNCSFHDNLGTALTVYNTNITLAENEFIHNQCASEMYGTGCGITALNSNLILTGNTTFIENSASSRYSAGAIWASTSSLHFTGRNNFMGNSANSYNSGGAIHAEANTFLSFNGTSNFNHNSAYKGGAIYTSGHVVLTFNGTNNFINNSANFEGGAIHAKYTLGKFIGSSTFSHNSAPSANTGSCGGAILTRYDVVLTFDGINNFFNNSAGYFKYGGAIFAVTNVLLCFIGTSNFTYNSAYKGGAIYAVNNIVLTFNGTNNFIKNSIHSAVDSNGGAIYTSRNVVLTFNGTNNFTNNLANIGSGGAIHAQTNTRLSFIGTSHFSHNLAVYNHGGAIYTDINVVLTFSGSNNFFNNSAAHGGVIYAGFNMLVSFTGTSNFSSNSAMDGGAIYADSNSTLTFNGSISFINNGNHINKFNSRVSYGGAMYLFSSTTLSILPYTTLHWENNHANLGGAIYVYDINPFTYCTQLSRYIPKEECFFQLTSQSLLDGIDIKLVFKNNTADTAGSILYGGVIDKCTLRVLGHNSGEVFDMLVQYQADNTASNLSSDPFHICPCKNNHPNCNIYQSNKILSIYPGETFQVSVVSTGQRNGIVPAEVKGNVDRGRLLSSQYVQQTTKTCTTLNYTVFSQQTWSKVELYVDGPCSTFGDKLVLELNINRTCPPGFEISQDEHSCVCDQAFQQYTNNCNITNGLGQITRESDDTFWIGYDQSHGLTVHPQCPFDYCVDDTVVFPLNNTNIQCAYHRSGLLCGACNSKGYSLVLGSSRCKQCTNIYLLLLIPFALMGIALVFLLLVCKLTVATGTLSGLVFYANIVGANRDIFCQ